MADLWYISFATDEGFRGATVVEALSAEDALAVATQRGLNPGGEAAIFQAPTPTPPDLLSYLNRLVGKEELLRDGASRHGDLSDEKREAIESHGTVACERCNSPPTVN